MKWIVLTALFSVQIAMAGPLDYKPKFLEALAKGLQTRTVSPNEVVSNPLFLTNPFDAFAARVRYHQDFAVVTSVDFKFNESEKILRKDLVQVARTYAQLQASHLALGMGELDVVNVRQVQLTDKIVLVTFPFKLLDRKVHDAFFEMTFAKKADGTYHKRTLKNHTFGYLQPSNALIGSDTMTLLAATGAENITVERVTREWFPGDGELIPTSRFHFVADTGVKYQVLLNDLTQDIIEAEQKQYHLGRPLAASVWSRSYLENMPSFAVLPFTPLLINGIETSTDGAGHVELENDADATVILRNERTSVHDQTFNAVAYRYDVTLDGTPVILNEADQRATNAYMAINDINLYVRSYILPAETTFLDRRTAVRINFMGTCNAFYNGQITLYRAGSGCANMAEVNDVIYHEWGHGLDDFTGRNIGIQDGAFSEGIGDIVASYFTDSSNMGQGFFTNQVTGIRQLDNNFRYPEDRGEVHDEGRIIGGAFWHLRQALMERYGAKKGHYLSSKYFLRHLLVADNYTESYDIVLLLDDDDGDAMTPSPNHCLITAAFARHGLATADPTCVDQNFQPSVPVDSDVKIALLDQDDFQILVSYPKETAVLSYCFKEGPCGTEAVALTLDGSKGDLFLHRSDKLTSLNNHAVLRIEVSEGAKVTGARSFKMVQR